MSTKMYGVGLSGRIVAAFPTKIQADLFAAQHPGAYAYNESGKFLDATEFVPPGQLKKKHVNWVVNDIAELGVRIGNQFFFLYKGASLVYEKGTHDDGKPIKWRPVGKREFGECCHPVNYAEFKKCNFPHTIGQVYVSDGNDWQNVIPAGEEE